MEDKLVMVRIKEKTRQRLKEEAAHENKTLQELLEEKLNE